MCRPSRFYAILLASAVICSGSAHADDVAAYLERLDLDELLAVHLEEQLETAKGEEHDALLVRLAELYARLLETVPNPEMRSELERRGRRLLASAPAGTANELKLALLRASYVSAERIAENHRLRLSPPEDLALAKEMFDELVPDLSNLRKETTDQLRLADRRVGRAAGSEAMVLAERAEKARRLHSQCTFLTAWAMYYQSWLNDRPDNARIAQRLFTELLDLQDVQAVPENVSVDLRSVEAIARCILGCALCKSLTTSTPTALSWVSLLEHERAFEPLREQALAWKIVVCLENDEYDRAASLLTDADSAESGTPVQWLRLAAVHSLEAASHSRQASALAKYAVTRLAAQGELEQVFDIAQRYGIEGFGASGFALRYVKAVLKYHEAREAHSDDRPTDKPEAIQLYDEAISEFEAAQRQRDAGKYTGALPDCTRLIAWSHYFQGRLAYARAAFELAASELEAEAASDSLWMAIVCMDGLLAEDPENAHLADELATLIERFLGEHPSSEHAPKLVLRRAIISKEISQRIAQDLLAIPSNSEVYDSARRRAAQVLYRLFREGTPAQRVGYGSEYLSIALALHGQDEQTLVPSPELEFQRAVVRGRRILEVSLTDGVGRTVAANSILDWFDELREGGVVDLSDVQDELDYRRLQTHLINDDPESAVEIADRLWRADPEGLWTRVATRTMFRFADRRRRDAETDGSDDREAVAMIRRFGARVIEEYEKDPDALEHTTALAHYSAVAEAAMAVWRRSGDQDSGREALSLYKRLLDARPRNARFLRATAMLAEAYDDDDLAINCWRTLIAGSAQASDGWFEAKFRLISLLARTDPNRARAVMNQHRELNPDYGPDPWGPRLRALDLRLRAAGDNDDSGETGGRE